MKNIVAMVLCIVMGCVVVFSTPLASAVTETSEPVLKIVNEGLAGWENWKSENYIYGGNNFYRLYCPYKGATINDIFYYINKVVSENMGVLNERYGESGYNPSTIHLMFDYPNLGANIEQAYLALANYLHYTKTWYDKMPIEFQVWDNTQTGQNRVAQMEIALSNDKSTPWANHKYNPATGAYERIDVEFYDELTEIIEYKTFGERKGDWVQNGSSLYSWNMYNISNVCIIRSKFEIFDEADFDRSILQQPYTAINTPGKTEGKYVLVKQLSIIDVEPAVHEKIYNICENAKKSSDNLNGQLKYINDYLCKNAKYDYDFYEWTMLEQKIPYDSPNGVVPTHAYGALVDGLAISSGFSHAVSEICRYLKIPNIYLNNADHIYNLVYIDGKWKILDVTSNVTGNDSEKYFLVDDKEWLSEADLSNLEAVKTDTLERWDKQKKYDEYFEYYVNHKETIDALTNTGVFLGDASGELNMHKGLTRAELATLLTRLNGRENEVKDKSQYYASLFPFKDVPEWAAPYVGYCYEQGLLKGYNDSLFGSGDAVNVNMACTVILRFLNFEETDWRYETSVAKAHDVGIMPKTWPTGTTALRNDMAMMINYALTHTPAA